MGQDVLADDSALKSMGDVARRHHHRRALRLQPPVGEEQGVREGASTTITTRNPDIFSIGGYDGMHLIYETLKKTGGKADGDSLIAAAKGMKWESPRGPMSDRSGDARHHPDRLHPQGREDAGGPAQRRDRQGRERQGPGQGADGEVSQRARCYTCQCPSPRKRARACALPLLRRYIRKPGHCSSRASAGYNTAQAIANRIQPEEPMRRAMTGLATSAAIAAGGDGRARPGHRQDRRHHVLFGPVRRHRRADRQRHQALHEGARRHRRRQEDRADAARIPAALRRTSPSG